MLRKCLDAGVSFSSSRKIESQEEREHKREREGEDERSERRKEMKEGKEKEGKEKRKKEEEGDGRCPRAGQAATPTAGGGQRPGGGCHGQQPCPSQKIMRCNSSSKWYFGVIEMGLRRAKLKLVGKSIRRRGRWRGCWWPRWCR